MGGGEPWPHRLSSPRADMKEDEEAKKLKKKKKKKPSYLHKSHCVGVVENNERAGKISNRFEKLYGGRGGEFSIMHASALTLNPIVSSFSRFFSPTIRSPL
ncbi:hypothetical protein CEXT_448391 [Caerostris extrusa]|uniref:Uncharacterized protein n=1 Tax=Caerostris extrusa TaxID=172846 RepID=A0AAV4NEZ8_CAEEX|nr:hypothetical protein CEXT_448391 [Caerostris extrusa]